MTRLVAKDYKPLEKIIEEKKIQSLSLVLENYTDKTVDMTLYGDGEPLHMIRVQHMKNVEFFSLKLKKKRSLSLSELEINVFGIVKATFKK